MRLQLIPAPYRVVGWQVAVAVFLALLWAVFKDANAAASALAGGAICFVPSGLFALRLVRAQSRQDGYVFAFFVGEGIKVLLSIVLFGAVALWFNGADWLALIVSYIAVLQVYVFGLLMASR